MKRAKHSPKREYLTALEYYKRTVQHHCPDLLFTGTELLIVQRVWQRLNKARRDWIHAPFPRKQVELGDTAEDLQKLRPRTLVQDEAVTPELLASLASPNLRMSKTKSVASAVEKAHRLFIAARDYLDALPKGTRSVRLGFESYLAKITFEEILDSTAEPGRVPLLGPVQPARNNGMLTRRALEQALKRYAARAKTSKKEIQTKVSQALKDKAIPCHLLEEIRWERFRQHFKGCK